MQTFITNNSKQTQKLGELLAVELKSGQIICLSGDLGAGKTTFTQGLLKGLGAKGPYTSPTFVVMKQYCKRISNNQFPISKKKSKADIQISDIYHFDVYRVKARDILNLGWEEIVADESNVIIIEWAERIRKIIPKDALWIRLKLAGENKRKMTFMSSRA